LSVRCVFNSTLATTAVTLNSPANTTSNGPVLFNIPFGNVSTGDGTRTAALTAPTTLDFTLNVLHGLAYLQVNSVAFPNGDLRGQLIPLFDPSRRDIPSIIETIAGSTVLPPNLETLRHANQQGHELNPATFLECVAVPAAASGGSSYSAIYQFAVPVSRVNFPLLRGFTLELNVRSLGVGSTPVVWVFEWFDSSNGEFKVAGTITVTPGSVFTNWTSLFVDNFEVDAWNYPNNRGILVTRISTNSTVAATLAIDLMGLRSWIPSSAILQTARATIKATSLFPAK